MKNKNIGFNQNIYNYEQVIVTIIAGYIAALIPNKLSNIPHLLSSIIVGGFVSKSFYGDWDMSYQWTISDVFYWIFTIIESLMGGLFALYIRKISYTK
jgi:uncharacterized membrane protein YeaQ/YmgE (transglycosylase-associated protein family)